MHTITLPLADDLYRFYSAIAAYRNEPLSHTLETALMQQLLSICAQCAEGNGSAYPEGLGELLENHRTRNAPEK